MGEGEQRGDKMSEVTYRWIEGPNATQAEWDRIEEILAARGWTSLNRSTSRILCAEDASGGLLGFIILQFYFHTEPLWVRPSQRGTGLAEELADRMVAFMLENQARGWLVIAYDPAAVKLCESRGMTKVESPVYMAK